MMVNKRNLLKETLNFMKDMALEEDDVLWVGVCGEDVACTWEEFKKIADEFYDPSSTNHSVDYGLVIVARDWWLERDIQQECWEFMYAPERPTTPRKLSNEDIFMKYW